MISKFSDYFKILLLLFLTSGVVTQVHAQLDSLTVNYQLSHIQSIDFHFSDFPQETEIVRIKHLYFRSKYYSSYSPYKIGLSGSSKSFEPSKLISINGLADNEFSLKLLILVQYLSNDSTVISEEYYREDAKGKYVLTIDIDKVELTHKYETHSFIGTWTTGKDIKWDINFGTKSYETYPTIDIGEMYAMQIHQITNLTKMDSTRFNASIYDKDVIGSDLVMRTDDAYLSLAVDKPITYIINDKTLAVPCSFWMRIIPVKSVKVNEIYTHSDIQSFDYITQKDTMIAESLMRKIDFKVVSNLKDSYARLKANMLVLGWFMQGDTATHSIVLDSGTTYFSLLYPARHQSPEMENMRIELTDRTFTPYLPSIPIPYLKTAYESFERIEFICKTRHNKIKNISILLLSGNHQNIEKEGWQDFKKRRYLTDENYSTEDRAYCTEVNIHKDEAVSFIFIDRNTDKVLNIFVKKVHSSHIEKDKLTFLLSNGIKMKYKLNRNPYSPAKLDLGRHDFSTFQTDMNRAMRVPSTNKKLKYKFMIKSYDAYLGW
ncbi:MAG: hypothetical protein GQ574_11015 [Crocinitomix sp.]|nr:hypothetical protein [Crocinitomix sp.]